MLALVGSGEYLPPMEPVDRELLARLGPSPRVVCLPTAAGREGPERIGYWSRLGVEHFTRLGARAEAVPVIDRAGADDPAFAAAIAAADCVYLSGGKPDYLYRTLAGSRAWESILSVLARGGLLAGCSAGAMVMGEKFTGFPGWNAGFNLVPGVTVIPHYDEIPAAMIRPVRLLAGRELIVAGIDRNTALVRNGNRFEVLGAGGVTLWNGSRKTRFTAGELAAAALAMTK
jgi:cyanophycinase